jgi:MarR family transcriptional regulator, temperature-dependent positive regulator of motility
MTQSSTKPAKPSDPPAAVPARAASLFPPVPGRPADVDQFGIDAVTIARLWDNPCWFSFRINYLSLRYNIPLYGWVEKEYGLIRPQVAVIYALGLRDMVTARDIGMSYGFPKNTLSRAIHSLEKRGIVARRRDASDKRSFLLTLTAEGRAIFDETLPRFVGGQEDILSPLTAGERETLSVLLAKIVINTFDRPDRLHASPALIHSDGTGA